MGLKNEGSYIAKIERFADEKSQAIPASLKFELHRSAAERAVADGSFHGLRHVGTGAYRSSSQTMRGRLY
jgi:hypothetical protein